METISFVIKMSSYHSTFISEIIQLSLLTTDSEFAEVFMLTFYSFMTPEQLMHALIAR